MGSEFQGNLASDPFRAEVCSICLHCLRAYLIVIFIDIIVNLTTVKMVRRRSMIFSFVLDDCKRFSICILAVIHAVSEIFVEPSLALVSVAITILTFSDQETVFLQPTCHSDILFLDFDSLRALAKLVCFLKHLAINFEFVHYMVIYVLGLQLRNGWSCVRRGNLLLLFLHWSYYWLVLGLSQELHADLEVAISVGLFAHKLFEDCLGADYSLLAFVHLDDLEAARCQVKAFAGFLMKAFEIRRRELGDLITVCHLK